MGTETRDDSRVQCGMKWLVLSLIGGPILAGFAYAGYLLLN